MPRCRRSPVRGEESPRRVAERDAPARGRSTSSGSAPVDAIASRVAPLREIRLRVGDAVGAVAQRLEPLHRRPAFVRAAGARERDREVVGGGDVVGLGGERFLEQRERLVDIVALLQSHLPQLNLRAGVARVELQHALEGGRGLVQRGCRTWRSGRGCSERSALSGSCAAAARCLGRGVSGRPA